MAASAGLLIIGAARKCPMRRLMRVLPSVTAVHSQYVEQRAFGFALRCGRFELVLEYILLLYHGPSSRSYRAKTQITTITATYPYGILLTQACWGGGRTHGKVDSVRYKLNVVDVSHLYTAVVVDQNNPEGKGQQQHVLYSRRG